MSFLGPAAAAVGGGGGGGGTALVADEADSFLLWPKPFTMAAAG